MSFEKSSSKGSFKRQFIFWVSILNILAVCLLFLTIYILNFKYGPTYGFGYLTPVLGSLVWFFYVFYLFYRRSDIEFRGFIRRLNGELNEEMKGERSEVFFRKIDHWKIGRFQNLISQAVERNRSLDREFMGQIVQLREAVKNRDIRRLEKMQEKNLNFIKREERGIHGIS